MKFYEKFKAQLSNRELGREVSKIRNKASFRKKGFTIIELIVVIAIIAGFAIAGTAGYSAIRENQRQANHLSNISTIESGLQNFATDYDLTALDDTSSTVTVNTKDLGEIKETVNNIKVDSERNDFTTKDDDILTLLMPITDKHPLVTMGYLTDSPKNPWEGNAKFGSSIKEKFSYVYVADFKVSKKVLANPDGSLDQRTELQPTVRLMKYDEGEKKIVRDDFVVVTNGKTYRTKTDEELLKSKNKSYAESLKIYGYDFNAKTSGESNVKDPLSRQVLAK